MKRLIALIVLAMLLVGTAAAEEMRVWVMCQPNSYVTIRTGPKKTATESGYAYPGDEFLTDGKKRGGYLHIFAPNEDGEGWISKGYVTDCEPTAYPDGITMKVNVKQVNCRMCIGGRRRGRLKRGVAVTVYLMSDDWAVTNYGYIQSRYLE